MSSTCKSSISASSIGSAIELGGGEAPRRYNLGFRGQCCLPQLAPPR